MNDTHSKTKNDKNISIMITIQPMNSHSKPNRFKNI